MPDPARENSAHRGQAEHDMSREETSAVNRADHFVEDLAFGVWICDAQGGLDYASESFLDLLNMSMEEASGFGWAERLINGNGGSLERWQRCVASEHDWDDEHRIRDRDGRIRTLLARGHAVRDGSGKINRWVGVHLDITERKREEERLRALKLVQGRHEERERIARRLHDHLQQLLIGADFQLVQLSKPLPDENRITTFDQVRELLQQAITASRNLAAELNPHVLYDSGFSAALEWLAGFMQETHGLQLDLQVDIEGNPSEREINVVLFDAVRELLLNVVKHARVNHATVSAFQSDDEMQIVVKDGGDGFDLQDLQRSEDPAAGLGLSGVRRSIETLGGRCVVHSLPGGGTTVELRMPLPDA